MTTLPADELVERLREIAGRSNPIRRKRYLEVANFVEAQAAEISSLRAKLAEAVEVLEPIAECADEGNEDQPDDTKCEVKAGRSICYFLTLANFRAARRLIEGNGK